MDIKKLRNLFSKNKSAKTPEVFRKVIAPLSQKCVSDH